MCDGVHEGIFAFDLFVTERLDKYCEKEKSMTQISENMSKMVWILNLLAYDYVGAFVWVVLSKMKGSELTF